MYKLTHVDVIMLVLLIIGGVNWGLVGLAGFDLVAFLFGPMSMLSRLVYIVVGISALYTAYLVYRLKFE